MLLLTDLEESYVLNAIRPLSTKEGNVLLNVDLASTLSSPSHLQMVSFKAPFVKNVLLTAFHAKTGIATLEDAKLDIV